LPFRSYYSTVHRYAVGLQLCLRRGDAVRHGPGVPAESQSLQAAGTAAGVQPRQMLAVILMSALFWTPLGRGRTSYPGCNLRGRQRRRLGTMQEPAGIVIRHAPHWLAATKGSLRYRRRSACSLLAGLCGVITTLAQNPD
jgi:hypothetical protein